MYIVYSPKLIPCHCVSWEMAVIRAKEMAMSRRYPGVWPIWHSKGGAIAGVITDDANGLTVHDLRK